MGLRADSAQCSASRRGPRAGSAGCRAVPAAASAAACAASQPGKVPGGGDASAASASAASVSPCALGAARRARPGQSTPGRHRDCVASSPQRVHVGRRRLQSQPACSQSVPAARAHGAAGRPEQRQRQVRMGHLLRTQMHARKILRTWGAPRRRLRAASPASRPAAPAAHGWLPPAPHASGQAPGAPSAPRSPGTQRPMRWRSLAGQAKLANSSTARQRCRPQSALRAAARLRRRRSERALA